VEGPLAISECQDLNTDVMKEAIADLQITHMEFQNLQPKDKASNNSNAPSFSPTLSLHKTDSEDQISGTALITNASVTVEKEDHHEDLVLDKPKNNLKKDDSIPSCSLGRGLSQSAYQSPVPQTTSVPNPTIIGVNEDDCSEDDDDGALLRFLLRNTSQVNRELIKGNQVRTSLKKVMSLLLKKGEVRKHTIKIKHQPCNRPLAQKYYLLKMPKSQYK